MFIFSSLQWFISNFQLGVIVILVLKPVLAEVAWICLTFILLSVLCYCMERYILLDMAWLFSVDKTSQMLLLLLQLNLWKLGSLCNFRAGSRRQWELDSHLLTFWCVPWCFIICRNCVAGWSSDFQTLKGHTYSHASSFPSYVWDFSNNFHTVAGMRPTRDKFENSRNLWRQQIR